MLFFAATTDPTTYFLQQGLLGVVLVVLAGAFVLYYRSSEKAKSDRDLEIKGLNKIIYDIQELRRVDYKDTTKEVTDVLQDNSQNLRILSEKIEVGKAIERDR
jgi:hypothetical protein